MPALQNPRWERFAQAIVEGLANGDRKPYSQGRAYIAAGYTAKDQGKRGGSAECAASRLLNRVKPILERVRELQAIAARNAAETAEKMARELDEIQYEARADKAHAAAVSAVLGKAKVLGLEPPIRTELGKPGDFSQAKSVRDIGRMLLQQVDYAEPSDEAIEQAIAANEQFIETLQAIRDRALGLNVEQ
jgi:phage terminase small subunit